MAFVVRHRVRAREELNASGVRIGPTFRPAVEDWLRQLAEEAECRRYDLSADAQEMIERLALDADQLTATGWERWWSEGLRDRARAFLVWLVGWVRNRPPGGDPPWEFRMAVQVFLVPNPAPGMPPEHPCVVLALYEVDRVRGRIVVTAYPELPDGLPAAGG